MSRQREQLKETAAHPTSSQQCLRKATTPIHLPFNKAVLIQANNESLKQDIINDFLSSA